MTTSEQASPQREMRDSRRLTGPNVVWGKPGPVIDIAIADSDAEPARLAWTGAILTLLEGVGWGEEETAYRKFPGGLSLAFSAPMDALYAACEMNEWAWSIAEAHLDGTEAPNLEDAIVKFKAEIRAESNGSLLRLQRAAARRGALFLTDDDDVSIGAGRYCESWPVKELPEAGEVEWEARQRIPIAMITGTNGKTTTVRLLKCMVDAQGKVPGVSSTDWLMVGNEILDRGDWSGPGGARNILRHPSTEIALLETARGGMLRRGLGLAAGEADVALITNIAEDHLGEWGIKDLDMLADTKFIIRHAGKRLVLNAQDEKSVERVHLVECPITWFSLDAQDTRIQEHLNNRGHAAILDGGVIWWYADGQASKLIDAAEIPITMGGAARHNIANSLAAVAVAKELGLDEASIREGLLAFQSDPADNPGRLNLFDFHGVKVLVDFAHNPHGLQALFEMATAMKPKRKLVTVGHAGDRRTDAIEEVALTAWRSGVDRLIIKEQDEHLRGRELGEVPAIMEAALLADGAPAEAITRVESEMEATIQALRWAKPGDLLLLLTLQQREEVLQLLGEMQKQDWRSGQEIPTI
ncbi:MAG: Mur ligase family protein [Planctomycetota bacterium]|nr:Mur ligase family protein [Planctomycetota bacterium]MDA1113071.1 Mur ligase family protein [Planctomycetota bacterium]